MPRVTEPEKPVKFKFLIDPATIVKAYVPPVKLKDMALASVIAVVVTVMAVEPVLVTLITGVPVTVNVVAPVKTVPVLFSEMVFVPKASVPVNPVIVSV